MLALETISVLPPGDHRKKSLIFGGNPVLKKQLQSSASGACVERKKNNFRDSSAAGAFRIKI